jgi:hypothetical protein
MNRLPAEREIRLFPAREQSANFFFFIAFHLRLQTCFRVPAGEEQIRVRSRQRDCALEIL